MITLPQDCIGCPLFEFNKPYTLNTGDGSSGLLAVAEAPGEWEAEENRPLSPNGRSGKVFRRALREAGINAHALTITNVLRSRPPDNELRGQPYEREAIEHCSVYLNRTVREAQPRVILALGDVPLQTLVPDAPGSNTVVRGFVLQGKHGIPVISTYHPSYIARGAWHLYGAFKADIKTAYRMAREGVPKQLETQYELNPSIDRVREYLNYLGTVQHLPLSYDVETASIIGESEPEDWQQKRIIQIQFSHRAGYAMVLPYHGEYRLLAHAILALSNPKWGWNSRLSDDLVLRADGAVINGELHDLMNAWGHLQPGFWGKDKSDVDADKGVPSRLMGLQSCASFYCPEIGPWKHLAADPQQVPYYGAIDVDITHRCGAAIFKGLERAGLLEGYRTHKVELRPVLDELGEVGLPVDAAKQAELRTYVTGELQRLQTTLQRLVPPEVLSIHPKQGYKALHSKLSVIEQGNGLASSVKTPLKAIVEHFDPANPPLVEAAGHTGYLVQRSFDGAERWCVERLYNPHGSSPNTKAYIRAKGYRMPKAIDTGLDTTGKLELQRLAEETGDEVLKLTGEWREMYKTGIDYTGPSWTPGADGRVHATFRWGTVSGQTTAINPPVQTFPEHSGIAKRVKVAIRAEPGHTLVKIDMRGFHARMTGWLARDPVYYRLADFDVHSYVTAHFLHLHDAPYLLEMDDDELHAALRLIKKHKDYGYIRNYKVKRVVHGVTFGLRARKLYLMYSQNFTGEREAQGLIDLLASLFPRTFTVFPSWVENQIRNVTPCRLVSAYGHHRLFYDHDIQQATAYLPSNQSHCHIQSALVRLRNSGANRRYQFTNFTHDAGWYHCPTPLVADCIAEVSGEFSAPSTVLVDNPLGPFQCNSDAEVGPNLAEMSSWKG